MPLLETAPFCLVYRPNLGIAECVCLNCTMLDSSELGNNGELGDMHFPGFHNQV